MNESLILVSTSAAIFLAVACIVSLSTDLFNRDEARIEQRLKQEFQSSEKLNLQKSPLFRDLKMLQAPPTGKSLLHIWWEKYSLHLEQSGLPLKPGEVLGVAIVGSLLSGVAAFVATGGLVLTIATFIAGWVAPLAVVECAWHRRRRMLCEQLPDAFDQIRRSIRAGLPLIKAMQQIAIDFPPPLADEFEMCCQKQDLGLSQSIAMQELARRSNIMELQMFVVTVLIQRDIGGNTAEIIGKLSNVVRQRFRLASRIKALTAEGRMQALVLAALPILAGGFMMLINPGYIQIVIDCPYLISALVASETIGILWIRQITSINF